MEKPLSLLALSLLLLVSAGFTIGLTFAPCFASMCPEQFFPYVTRVHIAAYYAMLASIGVFLLLRAYVPWIHTVSTTYIIKREIPILRKRISLGGLTLAVWIVALTVATTAFWVDAEATFWSLRTDVLHWPDAHVRLAVTGIIGHHCDILLGLVVIPVNRNSILGRAFSLHQSTLLYAHKLLAYAFLIVVIAHGGAYYTFVGAYAATKDDSRRKNAFNVDNPTLTIPQSEARSTFWPYVVLPSGMLAFLVMLLITITALPVLRRRSYNTFYYIHVIGSVLVFFLASVHASTDFYFLLPGLLLWVLDWAWRLFRGDAGGLSKRVMGVVEDAGHSWYRLTLPVTGVSSKDLATEKPEERRSAVDTEKGLDLDHPLQTYYLNIPSISKLEIHAFTAAKVGNSTSGPVFLFQRSTPWSPKRKSKKQKKEWTWKVGAAVGLTTTTADCEDAIEVVDRRKKVQVRVEGPYIPREVTAFQTADRIVCLVGGTGLTGAYSMAMWWLEARSREPNATFSMIWTVRNRDTALLRECRELEDRVSAVGLGKFSLRVHVSSEEGRIDVGEALRQEVFASTAAAELHEEGKAIVSKPMGQSAWIYVSGPEGLVRQAEYACIKLEQEVRASRTKGTKLGDSQLGLETLEHHVAKWEV